MTSKAQSSSDAIAMMKAMKIAADGTTKEVQIPKPTVQNDDEILIQVEYAALDTATNQMLTHWLYSKFLHGASDPLILGWHFSGIAVKVGEAATNTKVGDAVFGFLPYAPDNMQGSFSEYIVVPESGCALKPDNVSHETAAASTTESLTALQALRHGDINKDQKVLVLGAAGGVGSTAVGIAKALGAHVTGVVSTKDMERTKTMGADAVIDRKATNFLEESDQYHVIFDTPGMYAASDCFTKLYKGGTYVTTLPSFGLLWGMLVSLFVGKTVAMVEAKSQREDLILLGDWLASGKVQIGIEKSYPIREMAAAYKHQLEAKKSGRVTIAVKDSW